MEIKVRQYADVVEHVRHSESRRTLLQPQAEMGNTEPGCSPSNSLQQPLAKVPKPPLTPTPLSASVDLSQILIPPTVQGYEARVRERFMVDVRVSSSPPTLM